MFEIDNLKLKPIDDKDIKKYLAEYLLINEREISNLEIIQNGILSCQIILFLHLSVMKNPRSKKKNAI